MKFLIQHVDLYKGVIDVKTIDMDITPTTKKDLKPIFGKWIKNNNKDLNQDEIEKFWNDFLEDCNFEETYKHCSKLYSPTSYSEGGITIISWFVQ